MYKLPVRTSGFTLIELLVVVAILLIITGGSIAAMIRFNDKQRVQLGIQEIQSFIQVAQAKARVREIPGGTTCNSLQGYRVQKSGSTLQIHSNCNNGAGSVYTLSQTHFIPVNLTVTPDSFSVEYRTLFDGAELRVNNTVVADFEVRAVNSTGTFAFSFEIDGNGIMHKPVQE